ncbi:hypothetical protein D3C71_2159440 [compost metagenome]
MARAVMSVAPPAANGTSRRTGRKSAASADPVCAKALWLSQAGAMPVNRVRRFMAGLVKVVRPILGS